LSPLAEPEGRPFVHRFKRTQYKASAGLCNRTAFFLDPDRYLPPGIASAKVDFDLSNFLALVCKFQEIGGDVMKASAGQLAMQSGDQRFHFPL
jgi:hypothetical protein